VVRDGSARDLRHGMYRDFDCDGGIERERLHTRTLEPACRGNIRERRTKFLLRPESLQCGRLSGEELSTYGEGRGAIQGGVVQRLQPCKFRATEWPGGQSDRRPDHQPRHAVSDAQMAIRTAS